MNTSPSCLSRVYYIHFEVRDLIFLKSSALMHRRARQFSWELGFHILETMFIIIILQVLASSFAYQGRRMRRDY